MHYCDIIDAMKFLTLNICFHDFPSVSKLAQIIADIIENFSLQKKIKSSISACETDKDTY